MNARIRTIVAGIAEIEEQDPHIVPAMNLAKALEATLHLVHAFPLPDPILSPPNVLETMDSERLQQLQSEVKSRLRVRAQQANNRGRIICHAVPGSASEAILYIAQREDADLVIVGAAERGKLATMILGTTAQRVLRASPVPVLVNRVPGRGPARRILFATDLSKLSAGAHERGLALVTTLWGTRDLEVRSLFVAGDDVLLPPPLHQVAMRERAEERLGKFLSRIQSGGLAMAGKVRLGLSAREILAETEEWSADLLVLGTHGGTGRSRFLIGSVAETVLRKAPCDVLLIPTAAIDSAAGGDERI